jgi:hypothetical protein
LYLQFTWNVTFILCLAYLRKRQNLQRTYNYKSTKNLKKKTGRGPTRFVYFDRLDELLGEKPNNSNPHSIDVATMQEVGYDNSATIPNPDAYEEPSNTITPSSKRNEAIHQ